MKKYLKIFLFFSVFAGISTAQSNVITIAENMPSFPGGMTEVLKYFQKNAIFPSEAREGGYSGNAIVQFVIDTMGKVKNPQIIKSAGYKCLNDEAIRVVSKMSNWNRGYNSAKSVEVNVNLGVSFAINSSVGEFSPKGSFLLKEIKESKTISQEQKDSLVKCNKANYYYYEGIKSVEENDLKSALQKFNESLLNVPQFNDALYNKAVVHFKLGEKSNACETWNKIVALNKNDKEVEGLIQKYCNK